MGSVLTPSTEDDLTDQIEIIRLWWAVGVSKNHCDVFRRFSLKCIYSTVSIDGKRKVFAAPTQKQHMAPSVLTYVPALARLCLRLDTANLFYCAAAIGPIA